LPSRTTASGVPPALAISSAMTLELGAAGSALLAAPSQTEIHISSTASTAPLRIDEPSDIDAAHAVCAVNGTKLALQARMSRSRMPYFSLASTTIERPSGVSSASEASCAASASSASVTPRPAELGRLAVAERDGAGLVEQQRIDVARRFDRAARHGQHVEAHQPIHAGNADGRQQRPDGGGDQRHEQRHQHHDRHRLPPA
jgi:hypothetical protein